MAEVDQSGSLPIRPEDAKLYREEYKHGCDLFQRALGEYSKADEIHKKAAFREVMDRALEVMNETARELKREDLMQENGKIADDFQKYQDNESDATKNALVTDLNHAKKKIG